MRESGIIGIYLAAGQSTRMGSDKLRLPLGPMNLGNHALAAALKSSLDYVWVIANGNSEDWLEGTLYRNSIKRKWSSIYCSEACLGQAYSLRCGVQAALAVEATAVMVILADQPLITSEMIDELLMFYQTHKVNNNIGYVASSYNGLARPPVIFSHRMFSELLRLQGDQGARALIRKEESGMCINFEKADLFMDVDTVEDYEILLGKAAFSSDDE